MTRPHLRLHHTERLDPERHHAQRREGMDRLQAVEWGHLDEASYLAEHARLTAQLAELTAAVDEPAPVRLPLGTLMDGWRTGDQRVRHDLVVAFFDELGRRRLPTD